MSTQVTFRGTRSLVNFNPYSPSEPLLDSPRSLEACRRQGVSPHELVPKTLEECRRHLGNIAEDLVRIYYEAGEERRKYKLHLAEEERNRIIAGSQSRHSPSKSAGLVAASLEERRINAARRKQEIELKQTEEKQRMYEATMQKNRTREELAAQREALRLQQVAAAHADREQKCLADEARKRKLAAQSEALDKQRKQQQFMKQKSRAAELQLAEKTRRLEAKREAAEREQRHAAFESMVKAKLDFQARRAAEKRRVAQEREAERIAILAAQTKEKKTKSAEKQLEKSKRIQAAKANMQMLLAQRRQEFEASQQSAEVRLRAFEQTQREAQELTRQRAEEKQREIKQVKYASEKIQNERKAQFLAQMAKGDKRLEEIKEMHETQMKQIAAWEKVTSKMRAKVRMRMETLKEQKRCSVVQKLERDNLAVAHFAKQKQERVKYLQLVNRIHQEARSEEVRRISKKKAYQRFRLLQKIHSDTSRVQAFKRAREQRKNSAVRLRLDLERHKGKMVSARSTPRSTRSTIRPLSATVSLSRFPLTYASCAYPSLKAGSPVAMY